MDPLEYVLNRMEDAARQDNPAEAGYGKARKELLDGITTLRHEHDEMIRIAGEALGTHRSWWSPACVQVLADWAGKLTKTVVTKI